MVSLEVDISLWGPMLVPFRRSGPGGMAGLVGGDHGNLLECAWRQKIRPGGRHRVGFHALSKRGRDSLLPSNNKNFRLGMCTIILTGLCHDDQHIGLARVHKSRQRLTVREICSNSRNNWNPPKQHLAGGKVNIGGSPMKSWVLHLLTMMNPPSRNPTQGGRCEGLIHQH